MKLRTLVYISLAFSFLVCRPVVAETQSEDNYLKADKMTEGQMLYSMSLTQVLKYAELGNGPAIFELAVRYKFGQRGAPQDYTQALIWFRKSADLHEAAAADELSDAYATGHGVPQNLAEAKRWKDIFHQDWDLNTKANKSSKTPKQLATEKAAEDRQLAQDRIWCDGTKAAPIGASQGEVLNSCLHNPDSMDKTILPSGAVDIWTYDHSIVQFINGRVYAVTNSR